MSATVHFFIRSERPLPDNTAQLYMLFTINRKLKCKISLKQRIPIRKEFKKMSHDEIMALDVLLRKDMFCWNNTSETCTQETASHEKINQYIASERKKANDLILQYELMNKPLTLEAFKKAFRKDTGHKLFVEYFFEEFDNRRDNKWAKETIKSYKSIVTKIQLFKPSLSLNDINHKFLAEYENYMLKPKVEKGCGNTPRTVANNMKILKTLLLIAVKNGDYFKENSPFNDYKIRETSKELTTRDYLEPEELGVLESLYTQYREPSKAYHLLSPEEWKERNTNNMLSPGEHRTLKRFLFSCYTGLRFRDVMMLDKSKHIFSKQIVDEETEESSTKYYIEISMHKTRNTVVVPLIDKALDLINLNEPGLLFKQVTNQKTNEHLKTIQQKAKLDKYLTFHVARHSFATICFLYGISERVGQKLLGHTNRKFTEIYTHLSHNKLFSEMDKFNTGINKINTKKKTNKQEADIIPLIQNLSPEKLDQLKSLLKILGS